MKRRRQATSRILKPQHPPATLNLTGNNPATWPQGFPWHDNLGALFNHPTAAGNPVSETIYSTSTVDTSVAGTTTIDYWATDPVSGDTMHATRGIVIQAPANDNPATSSPAANDNTPATPSATGTDPTPSTTTDATSSTQ